MCVKVRLSYLVPEAQAKSIPPSLAAAAGGVLRGQLVVTLTSTKRTYLWTYEVHKNGSPVKIYRIKKDEHLDYHHDSHFFFIIRETDQERKVRGGTSPSLALFFPNP